jgi:hypothetical protein
MSRPLHFGINFDRRLAMAIADRNRIADEQARDHGASMLEHGDDAAHCSNGLSAQTFRDATPEERTVYRRWIRGAIMVYGLLALATGTAVWINSAGTAQTQLTSLASTRSDHRH